MSNIVAIVGRPNVGKSTLFNRFTESRQAITDEVSGVTRDRHYGKAEWNGREFSVIDTGGYVEGSEDIFETEIRKQVELAIDEANVILFLVDAKTGITDLDQEVVNLLRKSNKKVVLAVNKVDNSKLYQFGINYDKHKKFQQFINKNLNLLKTKNYKFTILNFDKFLCKNLRCKIGSENGSYYSDVQHLSINGSKKLKNMIISYLD